MGLGSLRRPSRPPAVEIPIHFVESDIFDAATVAEAAAIAEPSRIVDAATFAVAATNAEPTKQQIKLRTVIYGVGSRMDGRDKPSRWG